MKIWLPLPGSYNWVTVGSSCRAVIQIKFSNTHKDGLMSCLHSGLWRISIFKRFISRVYITQYCLSFVTLSKLMFCCKVFKSEYFQRQIKKYHEHFYVLVCTALIFHCFPAQGDLRRQKQTYVPSLSPFPPIQRSIAGSSHQIILHGRDLLHANNI